MKRHLKRIIRSFFIRRIRKSEIATIKSLCINSARERLTFAEHQEICEYWGQLGYKVNAESHKLFKTISCYDKHFVPNDLYVAVILPSLNPRVDSAVYVNKGTSDLLFKEIPQAKCYVKNISGVYWIGTKAVSMQETINYLNQSVDEFIIKPSKDSSGGKNVRKVKLPNISERTDCLKRLFNEYKQDFVVQEIIRQHEETAQFNPESLNTIRVCSLFLNNKLSLLTCRLRCGQNGAVLDNIHSGGVFIPILSGGRLFEYGMDLHYRKYTKSSNGIVFSRTVISNYTKIEEFVSKYHVYFPTCHLIAWDLAITEDGNVVMVEVNINGPCIYDEQGISGPFFGDRTDEVIEYVKTHPGKLYMSF